MPSIETAVKKPTEQELKAPLRASLEFALKESKLEEGEFKGLAVVFDQEIEAFIPTVIERGAFKKTLKEQAERIKILWQHNREEPIGFPVELKETQEGLLIHGKISDTARGRDALALMRDGHKLGKSLELSIGFEPVLWEMEKRGKKTDDEIRRLKEIRLNEVSFVTLGAAGAKAGITEVNKEPEGHAGETEQATMDELFQEGYVIQTVVFPKRAWNKNQAKEWLKSHKDSGTGRPFKTTGFDETPNSFRFRQRDPDDFVRIRPKCLTPANAAPNLDSCRILVFGGPVRERREEEEPMHRITLGEFLSPILEEMAELPLEVELAGDAGSHDGTTPPEGGAGPDGDATFPRLAAFDPDELLSAESFAGRVLSRENRKKIAQALTIMKQLLDAAELPDDGDDADRMPHPKKKKKKGRGDEEKKALAHVNEQWMDAELSRARTQLNRLNGG